MAGCKIVDSRFHGNDIRPSVCDSSKRRIASSRLAGLAMTVLFYFSPLAHASQTLKDIVQLTLINNPNIHEAEANLKASQEQVKATRGQFLPKVDLHYAFGAGDYDDDYRYKTLETHNEREQTVTVVQPIFTGLSTYYSVSQTKYNVKAAEANKAYTKEQLALQAAGIYLEILRSQRLRDLVEKNVADHQTTFRKVTVRYHGGGGQRTDVDLAKGRLADSKNTLEQVKALQANDSATFVKIVGFIPQDLGIPDLPKIPNSLNRAKEMALEANPELLSSAFQAQAANAAVAAQTGSLMPQINVQVTYTNDYNANGYVGTNNDTREMINANYNLFNGGTDVANISKAKQTKLAALARSSTVESEVLEGVTQAWNTLMADQARLEQLNLHVESSYQVLSDYQKQFDMGLRSLLDVLNLQDELFNARMALLNGQFAVKRDMFTLLANMGVLVRAVSSQ